MIAKLRELENALRAKAGYVVGLRDGDGMQDAYNDAADRVATLIAELGQEVGAVGYVAPNVLESLANGVVDVADIGPQDDRRTIPLFTSPAHTSEVRDAARYRWLRKNAAADLLNLFADEWDFFGNDADQLDAGLDAAMRQEGE